MNAAQENALFEHSSVTHAILRMAIPTVIGQIILVIYNMADTFYIGQTGNDAMITAVTICMPAFMFLSAISNLFGVGGASVIARALGLRAGHKVSLASAFAFWGCLLTTLVYSLLAWLGRDVFIDLLGGTNPEAHRAAADYLFYTVILGGAVTSSGVLLSHLIRAESRALHASIGIALGGILNILLDPLFIFVLLPPGKEAMGAAVATSLSNLVSLLYFIGILLYNKKKSSLSFRPAKECLDYNIPASIFTAGIPACVMTLFENISYACLDKLMSFNGIEMQAGIGVAKKVNMLAHCTVRGIAQGSLPMIGYNFAAGKFKRMRSAVKVSHNLAVSTAAACMVVCLIWARPLIGIFIRNGSASLDFGACFLRVLCIGGPFSASAYTYISFFQATGEGRKSFLLAILRKGVVDIPLMFALRLLLPVVGIVMATPLADAVCCVTANLMFAAYIRHLKGDILDGRHAEAIGVRA
ncbi:MAG: hypothetical protein K6F56_07640 [Oscillospiraceae bacterium]|nr:hypothetical protein [Oscillospiraceae bacterium]